MQYNWFEAIYPCKENRQGAKIAVPCYNLLGTHVCWCKITLRSLNDETDPLYKNVINFEYIEFTAYCEAEVKG